MSIFATAVVVLALAIAWSRRHPRPYPARFASLLDIPLRGLRLAPQELANRVALEPGMRALEIGPGGGYYTEAVATGDRATRLVCLDIQAAMLHRVRRRLAERAPALVCGSASALPFRDASFDRIFMVSVLGEIPDRASTLRECTRLLTDRGMLVVAEAIIDPDYIAPRTLVREAGDTGLVALDRIGAWPAYTQRLGRAARPVIVAS